MYWENFCCYVPVDLIKATRQKYRSVHPFSKIKKGGFKHAKVIKYELSNLGIISSNPTLDIGRLNYDLRLRTIDSSTTSIFLRQIIRWSILFIDPNVKFVGQNAIPDVYVKTSPVILKKWKPMNYCKFSSKFMLCFDFF